jgi:catechol 2,3-dioxygenase-like lactoylglutathione lyase family enzyme
MKRFHVHVSVTDLPKSIGFYSKLFGADPTVAKTDYAKWMLEDPRINFAISTQEGKAGLNHLGFQVDSDEELTQLRNQAEGADIATVAEMGASCCYAKSDKHWIEDPQGIAWETFHTLGDIPVFGAGTLKAETVGGCCAPKVSAVPAKAKSACCG